MSKKLRKMVPSWKKLWVYRCSHARY